MAYFCATNLIREGRSPNGQGRLTLFDLAQFCNLTSAPLFERALWVDCRHRRFLSSLPLCEPCMERLGPIGIPELFAGQTTERLSNLRGMDEDAPVPEADVKL